MNFHSITNNYTGDRYSFILQVEENGAFHLAPYNDGKGWVTIGVGFNLADAKRIQLKKICNLSICVVVLMFISIANAAQQPKICSSIHNHLIQRQQNRAPADFIVEYRDQGGGTDVYPNLDIDGDGINDSVVRSCGASIEQICFLFVELSSGEKLELEEEGFFLVRLKPFIYVVVGESLSEKEKNKRGKRRIYQLTNQTIKLICPHI